MLKKYVTEDTMAAKTLNLVMCRADKMMSDYMYNHTIIGEEVGGEAERKAAKALEDINECAIEMLEELRGAVADYCNQHPQV